MSEGDNGTGGKRRKRLAASRETVRRDLARLLGEERAAQILERRNLPPAEAPELLGDRRLSGETLRFLFGLPGWNTDYPVKAAMSLHPRCPLSLFRVLINSLRLVDLVEVMTSRDIPRAGSRMAADLFGKRLPETSLGRKKQLSRSGGRVVHEQLLLDRDPRVLEFLLESPLLTEGDLVKLLRNPRTTGDKVRLVAGSSRWRARYQLRLELARHPLTGEEARRECAADLMIQDLQTLLNDRDLSPDAQRLLYNALGNRIEEQSDEEQAALARSRPGRHTVNLLLGGYREAVIIELLKRNRLEPAQCLALANDPRCPVAVLELLARMDELPGGRDAVHEALRGNPALTPRIRVLIDPGGGQEES